MHLYLFINLQLHEAQHLPLGGEDAVCSLSNLEIGDFHKIPVENKWAAWYIYFCLQKEDDFIGT